MEHVGITLRSGPDVPYINLLCVSISIDHYYFKFIDIRYQLSKLWKYGRTVFFGKLVR